MRNDSVLRILVVEDETSISEIVVRVMTDAVTHVVAVADGKVAQKMIETESFDIFLLDVRTPSMTGKELYQWLRETRPELTAGVIFTTGDTMSHGIAQFLNESGRPFLPKPFTTGELKAIILKTVNALKGE